jgi:hypothetical protein
VHAVLEEHETPEKLCKVAPVGTGTVWTVQLVPFHRSTRTVPPDAPTATQAVLDVHVTAFSRPALGAGTFWIDQPVPFQRSTRGRPSEVPTATHMVLVGQRTPASADDPAPAGLGVD